MLEKVDIYYFAFIRCSVCVPREMPVEAIPKLVNMQKPNEDGMPWKLDLKVTFVAGEPNPSPCHLDPSKLHYCLVR